MRLKSKDIAAALGISPATVSMALNGRQGVNDKTKQKILEYVKQQTDAQAQQMQSEKCSCKGTVMMLVYIKNGRILERHAERMDYTDQIESAVKQKGFRFYFKIFYEHTGQLLWKKWKKENVVMQADVSAGLVTGQIKFMSPCAGIWTGVSIK